MPTYVFKGRNRLNEIVVGERVADNREALRQIHDELGITSIFVTHDQEEAFALADRVALLNHGRIEQFATPPEIEAEPASEFVRAFLE